MNEDMNEQDAEIARMKEEIARMKEENAHFAWRDKDKNTLITELVKELGAYHRNYIFVSPKIDNLLKKALAAVK